MGRRGEAGAARAGPLLPHRAGKGKEDLFPNPAHRQCASVKYVAMCIVLFLSGCKIENAIFYVTEQVG